MWCCTKRINALYAHVLDVLRHGRRDAFFGEALEATLE
jgi:hypothetical protein